MADAAGQPIRGLVFGEKWLESISQCQINGDYKFSYYVVATDQKYENFLE